MGKMSERWWYPGFEFIPSDLEDYRFKAFVLQNAVIKLAIRAKTSDNIGLHWRLHSRSRDDVYGTNVKALVWCGEREAEELLALFNEELAVQKSKGLLSGVDAAFVPDQGKRNRRYGEWTGTTAKDLHPAVAEMMPFYLQGLSEGYFRMTDWVEEKLSGRPVRPGEYWHDCFEMTQRLWQQGGQIILHYAFVPFLYDRVGINL